MGTTFSENNLPSQDSVVTKKNFPGEDEMTVKENSLLDDSYIIVNDLSNKNDNLVREKNISPNKHNNDLNQEDAELTELCSNLRNTSIDSQSILEKAINHLTTHSGRMRFEELQQLYKSSALLPLKEAVKLEMLRLLTSNQTPVSLLQDLLSRRGTEPKYELIQIEGEINEPIFKYRISIHADGKLFSAVGSGNSKKQAKHNAAKSVLDELLENNNVKNGQSLKGESNPIGQLQEACLIRKWPPPIYETEQTTGVPHERIFTVSVYAGDYNECGSGESKKIAKREAALNMLKFLETIPFEHTGHVKGSDEKGPKQSRYRKFRNTVNKISDYHLRTEKTKGPKLEKLLGIRDLDNYTDTLFDAKQFLEELCNELRYQVSFLEVEGKNKVGNFQHLVQVTTTPVSVFFGTGLTEKDAQTEAAKNALKFLHLMNNGEPDNESTLD